MAQFLQTWLLTYSNGLFNALGCDMAKISINFVKNPSDIYDVAPAIEGNQSLLMQSMDNPLFCDLAFRRLPQHYIVKDARVLGMSNIILNSNGYASLENICFNPNISDKVIDKKEDAFTAENKKIVFSSKSETSLDNAIFVGGHWNFGHWLFNHVARFCFIEEEMTLGASFLVPSSLNAKQMEILTYFGVDESNISHHKTWHNCECWATFCATNALALNLRIWDLVGAWCLWRIAKKALFGLIMLN